MEGEEEEVDNYREELRQLDAMEDEIRKLLALNPTPTPADYAEREGPPDEMGMNGTVECDNPPPATPHYLNPTFASTMPPYLHGEVERVANSFRSGSMWTLKKLPVKIQAGSISNSRRENMIQNVVTKVKEKPKMKMDPTGCFTPVTHIATVYEKDKWIQKCEADDERVRIEAFSRKPFMTTNRFVHKCEDSFGERAAYPLNILGPSTGVPDCEKLFREDVSRSEKFKAGPFRVNNPKQREKTRKETGKWTAMVFTSLTEDWPQLRFKVRFTVNDEFIIQFYVGRAPQKISKLDHGLHNTNSNSSNADVESNSDADSDSSPKTIRTASTTALLTLSDRVIDIGTVENWPQANALHKYMNNIAFHGLPCKLGLRRRGDRWGVTERGPMPTNNEGKEREKPFISDDKVISGSLDPHGPHTFTSPKSAGNQKGKTEEAGTDDEEEEVEQDESDSQSGSEREAKRKTGHPTIVDGSASPANTLPDTPEGLWITYSFFAPWVTLGPLTVKRAVATKGRMNVRRTAQLNTQKERKISKAEETFAKANPSSSFFLTRG